MKSLQEQAEEKAFVEEAVVAPVILKSVVNGNIFEAHHEAATALLGAGLYKRATWEEIREYVTRAGNAATVKAPPEPKPTAKKSGSTAVPPMTTASMPKAPKKGKLIK